MSVVESKWNPSQLTFASEHVRNLRKPRRASLGYLPLGSSQRASLLPLPSRLEPLSPHVSLADTGEKDKAGDKGENECEIVIDDEIREKDEGSIDLWGD